MIRLLSSFPTSIFTGVLVFCLTWWIVTTILSGVDADVDSDVDVDVDGGGHAGAGGGHNVLSQAFAVGFVPLPLALTILAFGAWAVSLLLQFTLGDSSTAKVAAAVGVVVVFVSLFAGFMLLRSLRKPVSKLFETEFAPGRHEAVGSTCRVRTLVVTDRLGDAEVLTGPTKGSLIRVRADEGRFARGDVAVIIDYDRQTEAFVIDDLDEMLRPG